MSNNINDNTSYIDNETKSNKECVREEERRQEEGLNIVELIALDIPLC